MTEYFLIEKIAGEAPEIFFRIGFLESFHQGEKSLLVDRLHGLAAEESHALVAVLPQLSDDVVFRFFREGLAVVKRPCIRIEAAFAVVGAAGNEKGKADARPVGDIIFFDSGVVHKYLAIGNKNGAHTGWRRLVSIMVIKGGGLCL